MPKFLSGGQFSGTDVSACTFWSTEVTTDVAEDFSRITAGKNEGQCIANAYFARSDISCFNAGRCNGEGKCLPCTKYKFDGMRMGITHSPPLEILRQFDGGLTEAEVKSPNLARFPPQVINQTLQDQTPYHILIKNVQAKIAKCCHWSSGDGAPEEFFLASIIDGPDTFNVTDATGQQRTLKGIIVKHSAFPDDRGTFFPIGTSVVAGFKTEPSFYLEPRTGLIKPGEGVIFPGSQQSPILTRIKQKAASSSQIMIDTINGTVAVCNEITAEFQRQEQFLINAQNTGNGILIESTTAIAEDLQERQQTACDAATESRDDLGPEANSDIQAIIATSSLDTAVDLAKNLAETLTKIADNAEEAAGVGTGGSASRLAGNLANILRRFARDMEQAGFRSFSKCEFFFADNNVAKVWNDPDDGTLPCNGVRTDCQFYTGKPWKFATDENLGPGKKVLAQAIQEIRVRSDDWERFDNPAAEFRRRFTTPFIWAFAGYVEANGTPDVEDMLLYRPKVLFSRGTSESGFQTMEVEKIEVSNFTDFAVTKSKARVQPGSHTLDRDAAPDFPSKISSLTIPNVVRLQITHPRRDEKLIYRSWSADKNKISIFGTSTPDKKVFLVNETALQNRERYNTFLETINVVQNLPTSLPGSPVFTGTLSSELLTIFNKLEDEQRLSDSRSPLGYDTVDADRTGYWQSIQKLDLIHNTINKIFAFILIDDFSFIFDSVEVDYRFLHSIPFQTSFTARDFSMLDAAGQSVISSNIGDTTVSAELKAETRQVVGSESVKFGYGYYGLRFRNRNLKSGTLTADNDLQPDPAIADEVTQPAVITANSQSLITHVGYQVVQYKKTITIDDWYVINDCGFIMAIISDTTANRVLPLPSRSGAQPTLQNVLVNGGGNGSVVAQFAIEEAFITTNVGKKKLVQMYRDPDGFGLPANYVLLGPSVETTEAFGRPDPSSDTVEITYTYLQAQSAPKTGQSFQATNSDEVVKENLYEDELRRGETSISFDGSGNLTAGATSRSNGPIGDLNQEYVWVFSDSDGRPIGRKYSRLLVLYYGLSCVNIEMYYAWSGSCTTYALFPDLFLTIGGGSGGVSVQPQGVTDPKNLHLGHRVANLIGAGQDCVEFPSCGDHEFLSFGGVRAEFEVIERVSGGSAGGGDLLRAVHVGAGAPVRGEIVSSEAPNTPFNKKRGALWYPYITCDRPRYALSNSIGPLKTQSTELINEQLGAAGFNVGANILRDDQVKGGSGSFGGLERIDMEAYRGVDLVKATVLDIHTTLRPCTESNTYGNIVLDGRISQFGGGARKRGQVDIDIYADKQWQVPPFGNLGRNLLFLEVSDRRGDYLAGDDGKTVSFRWMPIFPERDNMGASIELFSENLEPQMYRLLATSNPVGGLEETIDTTNRYTHRALVRNVGVGNLEYPFVSNYPVFLAENVLGKEPNQRLTTAPTSDIKIMWAWREQEKPIKRAQNGKLLGGIRLRHPEYFLDNRGLEVRIRPSEGSYAVSFTSPTYDQESGELVNNAKLVLGNGPAREIIIDFKTRSMSLANQQDTVYDTSLELGDGPFPCTPDAKLDNENADIAVCTCETDTQAESVDNTHYPARFLHLDENAPEGFFTIYASTNLEPPFAAPLVREDNDQPCCQCIYYIRGIYAGLDLEFIPTTTNLNPAFDSRLVPSYTWSRVPHGFPGNIGQDGAFDGTENLANNYTSFSNGQIFTSNIDSFVEILEVSDAAAIFPSRQRALDAIGDEESIEVSSVPIGELPAGSLPATDNISRGQDETIVLDFRFNTYVKINAIQLHFFAGKGWQVPKINLAAIDPQSRGTGAPKPTFRSGRIIASSTLEANGTNVPNIEFFDGVTIQQGIDEDRGVKFTVTLTPSYTDQAFWNKFAMEFQLIFDRRSGTNSMGIAGITTNVEAMLPNSSVSETIEIRERKYYVSKASPAGGNNPEGRLTVADSASAYWRANDQSAAKGGNKFRAYAWDTQIEDNQPYERGADAPTLERKQEDEYDKARGLLSDPYTFSFSSFIPRDEDAALAFYGGTPPSWTTNLSMSLSALKDLNNGGVQDQPKFGRRPEDREPWSAPGHAWSYELEENYEVCCPECPHSMVVNYNFAHLHDNLDPVKTAHFWEELPSGFTRILRSTETLPDPFFGQGNPTAGEEGGTGQAALLPESAFEDIPVEVLEAAGFRKGDNGELLLLAQGGE